MSAELPEENRRFGIRSPQRYDKLRNPPQFLDVPLLTQSFRVQNVGRNTRTVGAGSAWLMGSKTIIGTPILEEKSILLTYESFATNTPNIFFAVVHSRLGTVDTIHLKGVGDEARIGGLDSPLEAFGPGTVKLYALGPGSSKAGSFQGIGSVGRITLAGKLLGFEL